VGPLPKTQVKKTNPELVLGRSTRVTKVIVIIVVIIFISPTLIYTLFRKYFNTSCQGQTRGGGSAYLGVGPWIYFQTGKWTKEIAKPQVSINSNNSSKDCKNCNLK